MLIIRFDSGEYKCIADNGIGDPVKSSINIIVNCKYYSLIRSKAAL